MKLMVFLGLVFIVLPFSLASPSFCHAKSNEGSVLELVVRPNKKAGESVKKLFKNKLLELVLEKTRATYGDYSITEYDSPVSQARVISQIKKGEIFRVIATMDSVEREKSIWPIKIPVYKGLLGHRIFIIRPEDQSRFSSIESLSELKKLVAIQGHDWPDSDILESNGMSLYRSPNYQGIFQMIQAKRGDYFPRGVHEPWKELERNRALNLAVEKSLLLKYDAPSYFFVRYGDEEMHNRISEGFLTAIADGSFNKLFYNDPEIKDVFRKASLKERRVFYIENPSLPPDTPLENADWWYKIGDEISFYSGKQ